MFTRGIRGERMELTFEKDLELLKAEQEPTLTSQNPLFCRFPNMKLYIDFLGTLQNSGFWLAQVKNT